MKRTILVGAPIVAAILATSVGVALWNYEFKRVDRRTST